MKYGAHIYLWIEKWSSEEKELIRNMKDLGLDSVEISIGDDIEFDPVMVRRLCEDNGLELALSPGGDWPMEADISHDDKKNRDFGIAWHKKWMEAGSEAGAVAYAGALYAHPGRVEKRRPVEDELKYCAENLHLLAEYGRKLGVQPVLEPMSHFRTHLVNTPAQLMKLVDLADHENIGVLLDTYHLMTEVREFESGIKLMADRLFAIHACENDRGVPGGGLVPWDQIFSALAEIGYDGRIVFETYNSSVDDFAFSRGMFHDVCPDGNEFVKTGMEFIRGMVKKYY